MTTQKTQVGTLRIAIVGHVDHGKSTLIGRLLYDTGSLPAERYEEIRRTSERQGRPFEFAYLMDALEEEREHNVTIDTAQTFFHTERRNYVIIDAPGHKEFLKNMITGAAGAEAAILLVDAAEGLREQTRRHAFLLSLLGIANVLVLINKLDLVDYSRDRFETLAGEVRALLAGLGVEPAAVLPGSAREGQNIARRPDAFDWHQGPTLLDALEDLGGAAENAHATLRLPIQDVYKWDDRRVYAGRIESGRLRVGDEIRFAPSGKITRVKQILRWPGTTDEAGSGDNVALVLDEERFIERGEILHHPDTAPVSATGIEASLFWLGAEPLRRGGRYTLQLGTARVTVVVDAVEERIDSSTLKVLERDAEQLNSPETARVRLRALRPLAADAFETSARTGRFVLHDGGRVAGGGIVLSLTAAERDADEVLLDSRLDRDEVIDLRRERGRFSVAFEDSLRARADAGLRFVLRDAEQAGELTRFALGLDLRLRLQRGPKGIEADVYTHKTPSFSEPLAVAAGV